MKAQKTECRLEQLEAYLVIAFVVGDTLGVLPVEVKAMLYQELHRLWLYDIFFHAQQGEIEHLGQIAVFTLEEKEGLPCQGSRGKKLCSVFPRISHSPPLKDTDLRQK